MSKAKARVITDGSKGFFGRVREHARKLDRGDRIAAEVTITFEDVSDMMRVLSAERVRLLRTLAAKASPLSELASGLRRDVRAVSRDVSLLESYGLLETRHESNPGHGPRRMVTPRATRYELVASI
jgi:predicted transcriptional regulator